MTAAERPREERLVEESSQAREDLEYVRRVVRRSEASGGPRAIWYLWAVIAAVGFSLVDFAPARVPIFWAVAGPAGFLASVWLGWRHGRLTGQESRAEGRRHVMHWGALLAGVFLLVPLAAGGALPGAGLGQAILLLVALGYFLAGVHLHRPLLWIGLLMAGGYVALFFLDTYVWTGIGLLVGLGLLLTARTRRPDGR